MNTEAMEKEDKEPATNPRRQYLLQNFENVVYLAINRLTKKEIAQLEDRLRLSRQQSRAMDR